MACQGHRRGRKGWQGVAELWMYVHTASCKFVCTASWKFECTQQWMCRMDALHSVARMHTVSYGCIAQRCADVYVPDLKEAPEVESSAWAKGGGVQPLCTQQDCT
eukprot:1160593-Pelagomonas_calceolata.AAC.5